MHRPFQVIVGNTVTELGQLEYVKLTSDLINEFWVVGIAIGGGAFLTVIIIILAVYKRKSTEAVRQFKKLQLQLNQLESNIRNECKQGRRQTNSPEFCDLVTWLIESLWTAYCLSALCGVQFFKC